MKEPDGPVGPNLYPVGGPGLGGRAGQVVRVALEALEALDDRNNQRHRFAGKGQASIHGGP